MKILLTGASLLAATGVFLASMASAEGELYQWTDDAGQRVYGENPPNDVEASPVTQGGNVLSQEQGATEDDGSRAMTWEEEVSGTRQETP